LLDAIIFKVAQLVDHEIPLPSSRKESWHLRTVDLVGRLGWLNSIIEPKHESGIRRVEKMSVITSNDYLCSARIMSAAFSPILMQAASYGQLDYSVPSNTVQLKPALSCS